MQFLQVGDEIMDSLSVEELGVAVSAQRAVQCLITHLSNYVAWLDVPNSLDKLFHRTIVVAF